MTVLPTQGPINFTPNVCALLVNAYTQSGENLDGFYDSQYVYNAVKLVLNGLQALPEASQTYRKPMG